MNSVRSNDLSLEYQRFTPSSGCKDIVKFEFVAKTRFLYFTILVSWIYDVVSYRLGSSIWLETIPVFYGSIILNKD